MRKILMNSSIFICIYFEINSWNSLLQVNWYFIPKLRPSPVYPEFTTYLIAFEPVVEIVEFTSPGIFVCTAGMEILSFFASLKIYLGNFF